LISRNRFTEVIEVSENGANQHTLDEAHRQFGGPARSMTEIRTKSSIAVNYGVH
jgi:hypothetical protein